MRAESCPRTVEAAITAARSWDRDESDVLWLPGSTRRDRAIPGDDYAPVAPAQSTSSFLNMFHRGPTI